MGKNIETPVDETTWDASAWEDNVQCMQLVMQNIHDHINVISPDGTVLWAHHGSEGVVTPSQKVKCWQHFEKQSQRCAHCVHPQIFKDKKKHEYETIMNGKDHWWVRAVPLLDAQDEVKAIVEIASDITALRRLEAEEQALDAELQRLRQREMLSLFAGGMAHTINNRLMSILGYSELMADEIPEGSPAQAYIDIVRQECDRVARVCRQMLDYTGREQQRFEPLDLCAVVQSTCDWARTRKTMQPTITCDLPTAPVLIYGDQDQISQMMQNLFENAFEAMGAQESPKLNLKICEHRMITPYSCEERLPAYLAPGNYCTIKIADNGCGMDEETKTRVFAPYHTGQELGRGLGLSVVEGILKTHKGGIEIDSTVGTGTEITLYLPAYQAKPTSHTPQKDLPLTQTNTVLLVDEEDDIRRVVTTILRKAGYEVLSAESVWEAKRILSAGTGKITCLLLDMEISAAFGNDLIETFRSIRPDIRIIVQADHPPNVAASILTFDKHTRYIEKPYTSRMLLSTMGSLLNGSNHQRPRCDG